MSEISETTSAPRAIRVAVLDDYQGVARHYADWELTPEGSELRFFRDHLSSEDALVLRLARFEAVVAMRERTPFPRSLLTRLAELALARHHGRAERGHRRGCGQRAGASRWRATEGLPYPTAELTWALILALARHVPAEDRAIRAGYWQTSVGIGLQGKGGEGGSWRCSGSAPGHAGRADRASLRHARGCVEPRI